MAGGFSVKYSLPNLRQYQESIKKVGNDVVKKVARAITQAALNVKTDAQLAAAVDVGGLRSNIRPVLDLKGIGLAALVVADAKNAAFVELGTGPLGRSTNRQPLPPGYVHGPAYFPPAKELDPWANRHKIDGGGFVVARAIFKKGGTKARPFLGPAFDAQQPRLIQKMEQIIRGQKI